MTSNVLQSCVGKLIDLGSVVKVGSMADCLTGHYAAPELKQKGADHLSLYAFKTNKKLFYYCHKLLFAHYRS